MKAELSTVRNSSTDLAKEFTPEIFTSIESEYRRNKEFISEAPVRQDSSIERLENGSIVGVTGWSSFSGSVAVFGAGANVLLGFSMDEPLGIMNGIAGFLLGGAVGLVFFVASEIVINNMSGKSWSGLLETRVLQRRRSKQIKARAELEHLIAVQEHNRNKSAAEQRLQEVEEKSKAIVEAYNKSNDRKIEFTDGVFSFDTKKLTRLEEIAYVAQQKAIEPSSSLALGE